MMNRYRIYTEDTGAGGRGHVARIVSRYADGFTMYRAVGFWRGKREQSLVIEVLVPEDGAFTDTVLDLVRDIKAALHQESVLWTRETVVAGFE